MASHIIRMGSPNPASGNDQTVSAGVASITAAASAPAAAVKPSGGIASIIASGQMPAILLRPSAGLASVTATARNASTSTTNDPSWATTTRSTLSSQGYGTTYTVPTGAGYTDGSNCSANVYSFIASKANGSRIVFPAATYTWSGRGASETMGGVVLLNRSNLTIDCSAATFVMAHTRPAISNFASMFYMLDCTNIRIISPTVRGGALLTGTDGAYTEGDEKQNGVFVAAGSTYIEVSGASFDDMLGWPYLIHGNQSGHTLSHHIWIHDGRLAVGGVSNFATVGGDYVIYEDMAENQDATWAAMDFEPDDANGHCRHYLIQRNGFRRWGWRGAGHTDWWLAMGKGYNVPPQPGYATMNDITVRDNVIYEIQPRGQGMVIAATGDQPYSDVTITGNVQMVPCTVAGSPMSFANFGNLTVTGNTVPTVGHVALVGSDTNPSGTHVLTPNYT